VTNGSASVQPFIFILNGQGSASGPFGFNNIVRLANGTIRMNLLVVPTLTYQLQTSTNLVNWSPLTTFTPATNPYSFTDTTLPLAPYQFYRMEQE